MTAKQGRLTSAERTFAEAYAATGDKLYAAEKAGYAQPRVGAHRALQRPDVVAEVRRVQSDRIGNELLPAAVQVHMDVLCDVKAPYMARLRAVELAYKHAFGDGAAADAKQPHEMTPDELALAIENLKSERAKPAQVIEGHVTTVEHEAPAQPEMGCLG